MLYVLSYLPVVKISFCFFSAIRGAVAHGCAVMSMDGWYFAKSQEGGAIFEPVVAHGCAVNEPKDGEDGITFLTYNIKHTTYNVRSVS